MTYEKFESEVKTLKKFIELYCSDKHQNRTMHEGDYEIPFKNNNLKINITLCDECNAIFANSIKHLQECPHEEKPRCRKCPNPCYSKEEWKQLAKIMKYSGMKLGLTKVGNKIKKLFGR